MHRARLIFFRLFVMVFSALSMNNLYAHGGVEVQGNKCLLTVGAYKMLFTGYQPKTSGEEFCDDIPLAGQTIIVLDFIDPILRSMMVDYRVLHDVNDVGITATLEDVAGIVNLDDATIFYISPKQYPTGTFMVNNNFQNGQYIGVLTVKNTESGNVITSVFPFTVGIQQVNNWLITLILALFIVLVIFFYRECRTS